MANKTEQIKRAMVEAMEQSLGVVTTACKKVGIGRTTYYEYYNTDSKFKAEIFVPASPNLPAVATLPFAVPQSF